MLRRDSDIEVQLPGAAGAADSVNEADIEMLSGEQAPPLSLPTRLAARFSRKPSVVRRSSAASSRRSSISSLHSHHSSTSSHGAPPTDNIAQHLRRTSILESRKARLADRALHAEKVRLRAALGRAASRNLQREERALAAQQARERLLAEITAKCEEEVRRAKKKAEDNRERKAAEHARLRLEMAEKFAEAEKRRVLYQQSHRRYRTGSIPTSEEKKMTKVASSSLTQDAAVRIIQRMWRAYHTRRAVQAFRALDLTTNHIQHMDFEDVGTLLSENKVLAVTARVLQLCGLQDMESGTMGGRGAVRTFLSSYLIVTHPAEVLSSNGEQEQDLIAKARELILAFEQATSLLLSSCRSTPANSTELQTVCEAYNVFFSAFHSWKTHDSSVLIEIMLAQFVELELIWQTVKNDQAGGVADDYRQGIRQNQILLLARLKRLAGSERAMQLVRGALKMAKRETKRNTSRQAIPRSAEVAPSSAETLTESVTSPISDTFNNVESTVLRELERQRISPHERFTRILTALPENRALVHELLINKEFKIEEAQYTEPRKQIMGHMCDMMRRDVDAGLGTNWTVAMATVIQDRLLRSLRPGNSLHVLISEVLDPKLVENQCNAGTFSYASFFNFMNTILPKLCAPYRDPIVKAFTEDTSGDTIDRLARLMGIIDLLSLDHTNFMIQLAAPQLIQEAPGYEQRNFEKGLRDGSLSLRKVRRFWRTHHKIVVDEIRKRDPENINGQPRPPTSKIYAQGLVDLVLSNSPVSDDMIPETLELDRQRLRRLHAQAFKIVATASILLAAKNLLKRDVRSQWKTEADRIMSLHFGEIELSRVQSILESTHPMPSSASTQLAATIRRVLAPVSQACAAVSISAATQATVEIPTDAPIQDVAGTPSLVNSDRSEVSSAIFTDPVARLILSRLRAHVLSRLSASSAAEKIRTTTTASQCLAGAGMPEFVNEVGKLIEELEKVRDVDWLCHGVVYEQILGEGNSTGPRP
ncbi:T-complex protein 11-domain-containing protein [Aspergillus bertholletiae]|uniref:T-complex protein 11-domain-containing protein n=1 Tax=Aspergillus bertholletiae TaxID=1226010 RepID=A0A5N7BCJ5_9EURO|nr:T-complex protein 11-domain-containing protein [Aspergillus bertholletiae]